jgi:hypothetical protein
MSGWRGRCFTHMMPRKFSKFGYLREYQRTTWLGCMKGRGGGGLVRSAYHLAINMDALESEQVGSSSRSDGSRPLFNKIWSARVPLKVRVFA